MTDQNKPDDAANDATGSGESTPAADASEAAAESIAERRRRRRADAEAEAALESRSRSRSEGTTNPRARKPFMERRREKIREEIARNRRGEYTVPTWVLVAALIAILVGWAAIIILV